MESFIAKTRKVGNSVGLLIPKEAVERGRLSIGQEVGVSVSPKVKDSLRGRFRGCWTREELDEFVRENKDAWGG